MRAYVRLEWHPATAEEAPSVRYPQRHLMVPCAGVYKEPPGQPCDIKEAMIRLDLRKYGSAHFKLYLSPNFVQVLGGPPVESGS